MVKSGRTLTVCRSEVFGVEAGRRTPAATGRQTLICRHGQPDR
ncbi:hypothetical protein [Nocardia sp. BMG51109]|nr:hypothetical protein [Nocardia sp. BMG51109]